MVGALAILIEAGKVKWFSAGTVSGEGCYTERAAPVPSQLRASDVRFLHSRRGSPIHLGQLPHAKHRNLHFRRIPRCLSSREYAPQASRRDQALLRPLRPIRHAQLHERPVRRQFLFQQSSRLRPQSQRSVDPQSTLHLRHPLGHRPRPLGKQRPHPPPSPSARHKRNPASSG